MNLERLNWKVIHTCSVPDDKLTRPTRINFVNKKLWLLFWKLKWLHAIIKYISKFPFWIMKEYVVMTFIQEMTLQNPYPTHFQFRKISIKSVNIFFFLLLSKMLFRHKQTQSFKATYCPTKEVFQSIRRISIPKEPTTFQSRNQFKLCLVYVYPFKCVI